MTWLDEFTTWVRARGVVIRGVQVHAYEGRGIGIMATEPLEVTDSPPVGPARALVALTNLKLQPGAVLLTVPHAALRTPLSVAPHIAEALRPASVHGLLAADHALGTVPAAWRGILPTVTDLSEAMALCWPASLHALLPPGAQRHLSHQQTKFAADWDAVTTAFPQLEQDYYRHAWLLVNTRTFYYLPASHRRAAPARDDCMALNPFADCFNHSSTPTAEVQRSTTAFLIIAKRKIEATEEVSISYGNHPNDFLMIEYGFILEDNPWDEVLLDTYILPRFTSTQKIELENVGYLGRYTVDQNTVCYRTQVALRITSRPLGRWKYFVSGNDDGEEDQTQIDRVISQILMNFKRDIVQTLKKVSSIDDAFKSQKQMLAKRWQQVDLLLESALDKVQI